MTAYKSRNPETSSSSTSATASASITNTTTTATSSFLNGFGGLNNGSFFQVSNTVDTSLPPGMTPLQDPWTIWETLYGMISGVGFFYSPNVTWLVLAVCTYCMAPYNLTLPWNELLVQRCWINHIMVFAYVGFWHVTLYQWNWCHRPFATTPPVTSNNTNKNTNKNTNNNNNKFSTVVLIHNMYYTLLGVIQWTIVEVAILYCCYNNNHKDGSTTKGSFLWEWNMVIGTVLACYWLPFFRDLHFYFGHRFLHYSCFYKYIHSLHHRNTIYLEPFTGLCMHPIEHFYYFTCYGPCLLPCIYVFQQHPFVLYWMGFHVLLSPAASHSGYEDHFSADLSHYLHHRYSNCNFGVTSAIPFDQWFGSYRDRLVPSSTKQADKKKDNMSEDSSKQQLETTNVMRQHYPKANLLEMPSIDHLIFNISWIVLWWMVYQFRTSMNPIVGATVVCMGPLISAMILFVIFNKNYNRYKKNEDNEDNDTDHSNKMTKRQHRSLVCQFLAPFDKDPLGSQLLHFGMAVVLGIVPAMYLMVLLLQLASTT